jgi:hypothetical protein
MFRLQVYVDNYRSSKHINFDINGIISNIQEISLDLYRRLAVAVIWMAVFSNLFITIYV